MDGSLKNFRVLKIAAVGLTCTAALAIGLTIWWLHSETISNASVDTEDLANVIAEQIDLSIQSIDLMTDEVENAVSDLDINTPNDAGKSLEGVSTYQRLKKLKARLSQVAVIALVDKRGNLVSSTNSWPLPATNVSDREHFQHLMNNDDRAVYISSPVKDRIAGEPTIFFSRRINDANHRFLGTIAVGVRLSYFEKIYKSIISYARVITFLSSQ